MIPHNSFYKIKQLALGSDLDIMGHTLEFIAPLKNKAILLVGDFNARTGNLDAHATVQHSCKQEFTAGQIDSYPSYHKQQASRDPVVNNEWGKIFLDLIQSCKMSILNGFTLGDVLGE